MPDAQWTIVTGAFSPKGGISVKMSLEQRVREHLCQVYGLGMDDVQELFEIGRDTVDETLCRLDEALAGADWSGTADAAHMLKGTLFNMGLTELGESAKALELAAKDGREDDVRTLYPELRRALEPLRRPAGAV